MTNPARCTPTSCVHWETCARCERRFSTDEPDRDECYSCQPEKTDEWVMTKPRSLFMAVLLLAGCSAHLQTVIPGNLAAGGLHRLYCVDAPACTIYRSEQPTAGEFSALMVQIGLRSVVKLNSALEGRDMVPGGVEQFEHPWLPAGPVDHEDIAAALWDLEQAPKPVLIHCTHGVDRTGLLVALWRVKHQHVPPAAAWGEWRAFGRDQSLKWLSDAFERETGWKP